MPEEIMIITSEDIFQLEAMERGIFTDDYQRLSARIIIDKQDMELIGVKDGGNVRIENDVGRIVVTVKSSDDEPHPGIAFMSPTPWTYQLVREDVCESGRPDRIMAEISASGAQTTKLSELQERIRA
jgi:formylmethanofuran dehydrogenase subunit D